MAVTDNTGSKTIIFNAIPGTIEEFKALPEAQLASPYDTAALTMLALYLFPTNKDLCFKALDFLRGPRPMAERDRQFVSDRFRGKEYMLGSYFAGATQDNGYKPSEPLTITIRSANRTTNDDTMTVLNVTSSGCDPEAAARPLTLRLAKDGKWYAWEYSSAMLGIKQPASADPWA